ncbi:MAG: phenylalanine--tRNA ligase subunit beta [Chloroherpetonaceae bacterium]|nr:phenylalanine--tRNA ligase subunit beta [Chloroherpetonaceae bacterium]MDW8018564.1 phenylalanine--tRNA ligase subunit beta [Chloroherpetonaceae bacterium]
MKISLSWLKTFAPSLTLSADEIAAKLTSLGIEVEGIEQIGGRFQNVVVGKVLSCEKHPNADRLTVCKVDVGQAAPLQIVCGAPNVAVGQYVPVALVGAVLNTKSGETLTIKKSKIRGIESMGMICAEDELGLSDNHDGIMVLAEGDAPFALGTPFEQYVEHDTVFDISITPNRPDVLSHLGVARELVGVTGVAMPHYRALPFIKSNSRVRLEDPVACPHYAAVIIKGVKITPSPDWLQRRLRTIGLRPINNVVDVTNYVLHSIGQPLHAFDLDKLTEQRIRVRTDISGEFLTLDGKVRQIEPGMIMICDAVQPVAIGGIMGGLHSEISDTTTNVLLESAYFHPKFIRRAAKKLGLSTDASYRFERGVDWGQVRSAAALATSMILELAGGQVVETTEAMAAEPVRRSVSLNPSRVNAFLGTALEPSQMISILVGLGFERRTQSPEQITFSVPSWRVDIAEEVDLIEEIARIYGYDQIAPAEKMNAAYPAMRPSKEHFNDRLREMVIGMGFKEVLTNPLLKLSEAELFSARVIRTLNPISEEMEALRPSLVPSLLRVIAHNQNLSNFDMRIFEIARIFELASPEEPTAVKGYREQEMLGLALTGRRAPRSWAHPNAMSDFFDLKGAVEEILRRMHLLEKSKFIPYTRDSLRLEIVAGGNAPTAGIYAGLLQIVPAVHLSQYGIEQPVYLAELNLDVLRAFADEQYQYVAPARFPAVVRDLAFYVPFSVASAEMIADMRKVSNLIEQVEVFDVYEPPVNGHNAESKPRRSIAFSLKFVSHTHTFTESEISALLTKVIEQVQSKYGAELRQS